MTPIERLLALAPWEQISEEDFFWVSGLYVSIRGCIRLPRGAHFLPNQKLAEKSVMHPDAPPPPGTILLAYPDPTATTSLTVADGKGGSRPANPDEEKRVSAALDRVLNVFEDKTDSGVKFPITFNLEEADW